MEVSTRKYLASPIKLSLRLASWVHFWHPGYTFGTLGTIFLAKCPWRHAGYTFFQRIFLVVRGRLEIPLDLPKVYPGCQPILLALFYCGTPWAFHITILLKQIFYLNYCRLTMFRKGGELYITLSFLSLLLCSAVNSEYIYKY